jgi:hypothetical protein
VRAWLLLGLFVGGFVSLMGCSMVSEQPEFEVTVRKDGDTVETAVVDNTVVFDIYSQIGIGDAEVQLTSGEWPETILFRVNLAGLEEFKFSYGDTVVTLSVSSSGEHAVLQSVSRNGEEQPVDKDSSFFMPMRIESVNEELSVPVEDGYFEIMAPQDFHEGDHDAFAISWVDFYR